MTFTLVNTKTSERFFNRNGNEIKNVQAGTIVTKEIVSDNYDFFLVSQYTNRGCSVPLHYKVVYSTSKLEEGILQQIVYSQCFNYVNWTGSIKIPGILQYAKKSAKFNSEILGGIMVENRELKSKMYYI